ncbi:hypothetical protein C0Q70_20060 [Pomacea canaliculata]|uniref:Acetylserotonin O-methyltransferase n=1 Tax=Pomacea canaliculata TaxID=400727 RepID=A0A2T7NEI0_POMCA|nr:hypothetical protein C0Q70_20060 [Pomacea canaliculata]
MNQTKSGFTPQYLVDEHVGSSLISHEILPVRKKPIAGTDTGKTKPAVTSLARGGVTGPLPEMTTPGPATFMKLMDCTVDRCIPALVTAFDLSTHRKAVDIGGGSGCLAHHLATVYPDVHVTVFDLPQVVEVSLQQQPEEMKSRVSFIGGNFFKDDYPMADLFIMARVLHDWDEERDDVLLTKVFNSLTPGGALLVLEKTLHDDKGGPLPALLEDIGMATLSIGHERSGKEYRKLLAKHGFDQIEIKEIQGSNHFDAIYAIKTEQ